MSSEHDHLARIERSNAHILHSNIQVIQQLRIANQAQLALMQNQLNAMKAEMAQLLQKAAVVKIASYHDIVTEIKDPILKQHFFVVLLQDSVQELEALLFKLKDLRDQSHVRELIAKIRKMDEELGPEEEKAYAESSFSKLYAHIDDYLVAEQRIPEKPVFFSMGKIHPKGGIYLRGILFALGTLVVSTLSIQQLIKNGITDNVPGTLFSVAIACLFPFLLFREVQKYMAMKQYLDDQERHIVETEMYQGIKTETEAALARHAVYDYIARLKTEFSEYAPTVERIRNIEANYRRELGPKYARERVSSEKLLVH